MALGNHTPLMPYDDRIGAVALALTTGIGWKLTSRLLARFGTLDAILDASTDELQAVHGIGKQIAANVRSIDLDRVAANIMRWETAGITIATWHNPHYPTALHVLGDKPLILFWKGQLPTTDQPTIAIVGTREPSDAAAALAQQWAAGFARLGWWVISGLARGIDTHAHQGALDAEGQSLALLGCGVNRLYPPENAALARRLLTNGAVMCEVNPDAHVSANTLVLRNRLITGLSRATLVMEAGTDGGAMDAARRAHHQGRPVFAPDNSPGNAALLATFAQPLPPSPEALIAQLAAPDRI